MAGTQQAAAAHLQHSPGASGRKRKGCAAQTQESPGLQLAWSLSTMGEGKTREDSHEYTEERKMCNPCDTQEHQNCWGEVPNSRRECKVMPGVENMTAIWPGGPMGRGKVADGGVLCSMAAPPTKTPGNPTHADGTFDPRLCLYAYHCSCSDLGTLSLLPELQR